MKIQLYIKYLILTTVLGIQVFSGQGLTQQDECANLGNEKLLTIYTPSNMKEFDNDIILISLDFVFLLDKVNQFAVLSKVDLIITNSFRIPGQKLTGTIVSPAKKSNHLVGHAIDFKLNYSGGNCDAECLAKYPNVPQPVKNFLKLILEYPGLRWGGTFKKEPDPIHIDDGFNLKTPIEWDNLYTKIQTYYRCDKQLY